MQEYHKTLRGTVISKYSFNGNLISTNALPTTAVDNRLDLLVKGSGPISKPLTPNAHRYRLTEAKSLPSKSFYSQFQIDNVNVVYEVSGDILLGTAELSSSFLPSYDHVRNMVVDKLSSQVRGGLDLSISAFEYRQTAEMLKLLTPKGLSDRALKIFQGLSRKNRNGSMKNFKEWLYGGFDISSDLWLQYQYGWRPLMSDIYGLADESLRVADNSLKSFEASAYMPVAGECKYSFGYSGNKFEGSRGLDGKVACKIGAIFDAGLKDPPRVAYFSSLNPLSIAWELTPYSFVADWFYDVGGFLRSTETALLYDVQFVKGYETKLVAYEHYPTVEWAGAVVAGHRRTGSAQSHAKYVLLDRKVLTSYPLPSLPKFNISLGSERLLSAAALLSQFLPRNPPRKL